MHALATETIEVSCASDVTVARQKAKQTAAAMGFDAPAVQEIVITVAELASNLVKHARGGRLVLKPLSRAEPTVLVPGGEPSRTRSPGAMASDTQSRLHARAETIAEIASAPLGLQVESLDDGPGIANVREAIGDGFTTKPGSLGAGLGTINRVMDEFDIASRPGYGTRVVARKWLRAATPGPMPNPFAIGVAARPHPSSDVSGDSFVVMHGASHTLVGVIDGLAHGQFAHRASTAAKLYIESHADLPLDQIFRGAGRACVATRGVVMALARFEWAARRMSFASVGNVEARVHGRGKFQFILRRGIVGLNAPPPLVSEHHWPLENIFVMHSDGLRTHWSWDEFTGVMRLPPSEIAGRLLRSLARDDDDATALVLTRKTV